MSRTIETILRLQGESEYRTGLKNCASEIEDQTVEGFAAVKHPKYEVYVDKKGEFRFRLKARNGEIIATGEGYKTKKSCLNGIASIKKNAPESPVVKE